MSRQMHVPLLNSVSTSLNSWFDRYSHFENEKLIFTYASAQTFNVI